MHKLGLDLDPDSLYRLLESPRWADQDSLLPDDRRFTADCRQALADYLGGPCPEPDPDSAASVENQAAAALLAELAGLSQSEPPPARREKNGKLPGKTAAKGGFITEKQSVNQGEKNSAAPSPSPLLKPGTDGSTGSWVEELDAGRLSLDFLHAVGVGRQPLDPATVAGIL